MSSVGRCWTELLFLDKSAPVSEYGFSGLVGAASKMIGWSEREIVWEV